MIHLPDKTVERLSQYRRTLRNQFQKGKTDIYSHEIAGLLNLTSVQIRRDLMLIGYSGTLKKGYNVEELINHIGKIIDTPEGLRIALLGMGNLGKAVIHYLHERRSLLKIVAAFDVNESKINQDYGGVHCYPMSQLKKVLNNFNIKMGVIATPPEVAQKVANKLIENHIQGILNFTPKPLSVPDNIYLDEYDMITSFEKVAFFIKHHE